MGLGSIGCEPGVNASLGALKAGLHCAQQLRGGAKRHKDCGGGNAMKRYVVSARIQPAMDRRTMAILSI